MNYFLLLIFLLCNYSNLICCERLRKNEFIVQNYLGNNYSLNISLNYTELENNNKSKEINDYHIASIMLFFTLPSIIHIYLKNFNIFNSHSSPSLLLAAIENNKPALLLDTSERGSHIEILQQQQQQENYYEYDDDNYKNDLNNLNLSSEQRMITHSTSEYESRMVPIVINKNTKNKKMNKTNMLTPNMETSNLSKYNEITDNYHTILDISSSSEDEMKLLPRPYSNNTIRKTSAMFSLKSKSIEV
jgi:hypothetical protein